MEIDMCAYNEMVLSTLDVRDMLYIVDYSVRIAKYINYGVLPMYSSQKVLTNITCMQTIQYILESNNKLANIWLSNNDKYKCIMRKNHVGRIANKYDCIGKLFKIIQ